VAGEAFIQDGCMSGHISFNKVAWVTAAPPSMSIIYVNNMETLDR
jgi:hypothetical protein